MVRPSFELRTSDRVTVTWVRSFRRRRTVRRLSFGRPWSRRLIPPTSNAQVMHIGGLARPKGNTTHSAQKSWPQRPHANSATVIGCLTQDSDTVATPSTIGPACTAVVTRTVDGSTLMIGIEGGALNLGLEPRPRTSMRRRSGVCLSSPVDEREWAPMTMRAMTMRSTQQAR